MNRYANICASLLGAFVLMALALGAVNAGTPNQASHGSGVAGVGNSGAKYKSHEIDWPY